MEVVEASMEVAEASMGVVEAQLRLHGSSGSFRKLPWKKLKLPQASMEVVEAPPRLHRSSGNRGTLTQTEYSATSMEACTSPTGASTVSMEAHSSFHKRRLRDFLWKW